MIVIARQLALDLYGRKAICRALRLWHVVDHGGALRLTEAGVFVLPFGVDQLADILRRVRDDETHAATMRGAALTL